MPRTTISKQNEFTFRCELASDMVSLFGIVINERVCISFITDCNFQNNGMGGCVVNVTTPLSKNELIHFMLLVDNGHRMLQTLDTTENYTGVCINRDFY